MSLSVGTRLGPYEIVAPLGAGGMGEVFRARDARLGRDVAIKVLPAALAGNEERLKRFEKEARSASALSHPNIVTVYDIGTTDGVSWIAMERIDGETLRKLLLGGRLPLKRLLAIAGQIAEGLSKAHETGIVHRDLKPENVMVTREGTVKVLDFGLAKLTTASGEIGEATQSPTVSAATEAGIVLGTVGYMSPEQALGEPLDFRSDQFSFGAILYEMLAPEGFRFTRLRFAADGRLAATDFSTVADLSDDGKTVLLGESGRGGGARGAIYLRKTDGSAATRLGDGRPLALSPDGKWAITTPGRPSDRLVLVPTGVGEPKTIQTDGATYREALWIPGTRRLLYEALVGGKPPRIYAQDLDGGAPRPVTPEGQAFTLWRISPDGKQAVLQDSEGNYAVFPVDGGEPRPVPGLRPDEYPVRWDAVGRGLWVTRGDFPVELFHLDLASGRREKTAEIHPSDRTGAVFLANFYLAADGKSYAYTIYRRLSTLFVVTGLK